MSKKGLSHESKKFGLHVTLARNKERHQSQERKDEKTEKVKGKEANVLEAELRRGEVELMIKKKQGAGQ